MPPHLASPPLTLSCLTFLPPTVTQLRAAHARGETSAGLDVVKGEVGDMWALGIREAYKSKLQVRVGALGVGP